MLTDAMADKFKSRSGYFSDLQTSTIMEYLNRAYRFTVPDVVPGQLSEGEWSFSTQATIGEYTIPTYVYAVRPYALLNATPLVSYSRWEEFWNDYDRTSTSAGPPRSVMTYNGQVWLRPIPDAVYTVRIKVRRRPSATLYHSTETAPPGAEALFQIDDETHAEAVIAGGLVDFCSDENLSDMKGSASADFKSWVGLLRGKSLSKHMSRRRQRTF